MGRRPDFLGFCTSDNFGFSCTIGSRQLTIPTTTIPTMVASLVLALRMIRSNADVL